MTFNYWKARAEAADNVVLAAQRVSNPYCSDEDKRRLAFALDDYARWLGEIKEVPSGHS